MLFSFKYFKSIYIAAGFLTLVVLLGSAGYMLIEGFTFIEALYMTVITVSTVGFREVHELSDGGRLFTSFLIISSFGTFAYGATSITKYVLSGEYKAYFRDYKLSKTVDNLQHHTIVCGYGRNGKQACKTLEAHKKKYVVIESNEDRLEQLREANLVHVVGDATNEENLIKAGIEKASALISTLPNDANNLFVVLSARELNKNLQIVSRASEINSDKKLRIAGANNVIMPDMVGGAHMASLTVTPDVIDFIDRISVQGPGEVRLEEIQFSEVPEDMKNKTIAELGNRYHTGTTIVGFKTPEGDYIVNPSSDTVIIPGSKLFVLGNPDQIQKLNSILGVTVS